MGAKPDKPRITYLKGRYQGIYRAEGRRGTKYGIDFYDNTGQRRRRMVGPSLETALGELRACRGRSVEGRSPGIYSADRRITFARFVRERYEPEVLAAIENNRTVATIVSSLKPLLVFFGPVPLVRIDEATVDRYKVLRRRNQIPIPAEESILVGLRPDGSKIWRRGFIPQRDVIAPNTVNRELQSLRSVLRYAVKVKAFPGELLARINLFPREHREVYRGSADMALLLDKANPRIVPLIELALATGRRKLELLTLAPKDVNWEARVIRFQRLKSRRKTILVPMNRTAEQVLRSLPRPVSPEAHYFTIKQGRLHKLFQKAVSRAKLGDFHFHDFRHVVGSHLLNKGIPDQMRAEVLGHAVGSSGALGMTQAYSHATLEYLRKVYEELDDLCGTSTGGGTGQKFRAEIGEMDRK